MQHLRQPLWVKVATGFAGAGATGLIAIATSAAINPALWKNEPFELCAFIVGIVTALSVVVFVAYWKLYSLPPLLIFAAAASHFLAWPTPWLGVLLGAAIVVTLILPARTIEVVKQPLTDRADRMLATGVPHIRLDIRRITIDMVSDRNDPKVVAWLFVANDGESATIEDWQMFYHYAGEEQRAGKQDVYEGWMLEELPQVPVADARGTWGYPEYIDNVTSREVRTRPLEAFFYAKLNNAQGFTEKDAATIFFRCKSMNQDWASPTVPPGNIRWGTITLRELGTLAP